jgi:hypothetical protein
VSIWLDDLSLPVPEVQLGPPNWAEHLRIIGAPGLLADGDPRAFHILVPQLAGENVATAIAFDHDRDCGLFNVGTVGAARRRGLGTALTALHLLVAVRRGCSTASLQSTPMAEGVYAAVGLRDLGRILEYVPSVARRARNAGAALKHCGPMNALCKAYDSTVAAGAAVETLISGGVPADDVRLLMGAELHDARREAAGGFAGSAAPGARVGAFAGEAQDPGAHAGSFAGDAASDSEGVFANVDRDVVVTHSDGAEQVRVAGHQHLEKLLIDAGLDKASAQSDVRALHEGRVLVLVTLGGVSESRARELLDAAA